MKITVIAKPGAKHAYVEQINEAQFRVAVKEHAHDGRANAAVVKALAGHFNVAPSLVRLISGSVSRKKVVEIPRTRFIDSRRSLSRVLPRGGNNRAGTSHHMLLLAPPHIFSHPFLAVFYTVAVVGIIIFELFIFRKTPVQDAAHHDRGSFWGVLGGVVASLAAIIYFSWSGIGQLTASWVSYTGFGMLFFGFFVRQWAIVTLDKYFTPVVALHYDHVLITDGPYRHLRHPGYAGLMLELVGAATAVLNIAALAAVIVCMVPCLWYRVRVEERLLQTKFGDAYRAYRQKTKKFIPYIW